MKGGSVQRANPVWKRDRFDQKLLKQNIQETGSAVSADPVSCISGAVLYSHDVMYCSLLAYAQV